MKIEKRENLKQRFPFCLNKPFMEKNKKVNNKNYFSDIGSIMGTVTDIYGNPVEGIRFRDMILLIILKRL